MKITDFLREIAEKGGIRDNDLEAALGASALAGVEIPDTLKEKFNQAYYTKDRAKNDPDIVTEISRLKSKEILSAVDNRIDPLLEFVDDETKAKITKTFETFKKLEFLKDGIAEGIKKQQSKKGSEDVRKIEEEYVEKTRKLQESHASEKAELLKQFKQSSLNTALKLKINEFQFGEAFKPIKDVLSNSIIEKLRLEQVNGKPIELEQSEDGGLHVRQNVDGNLRDIFDKDNNKVTVDSLLQKHVEPFIVKSNGKGGNDGKGGNGKSGDDGKTKPKITVGMTLHEMMAAQA